MGKSPFAVVEGVADLMRGFPSRWFVAGGWAIDLYLDRVTRPHKDIEVAILRQHQWDLRAHLAGWAFRKAIPHSRGRTEPWREGEWLEPPTHEIHARRGTGDPRDLEILLNESSAEVWKFRRNLAITRPLAKLGAHAANGVPFLAPEIVLLYKAKRPTAVDERDLANVLDRLHEEPRTWLRRALAAVHTSHPWLATL